MVVVKFTQALKRFYPELKELEVEADQVVKVLESVEEQFPGISSYLLDDQGRLRKHVNIFVNGQMIIDRENQSDNLTANSEVYIMQALSGG